MKPLSTLASLRAHNRTQATQPQDTHLLREIAGCAVGLFAWIVIHWLCG